MKKRIVRTAFFVLLQLCIFQQTYSTSLPKPVTNFIGCQAPAFELLNDQGVMQSVCSAQKTYSVLCFFPNTIDCFSEIQYLKKADAWFKAHNIEISCIIADSVEKIADLKERLEIPFTLLSDQNKQVTQAYGAQEDPTIVIFDEQGIVKKVITQTWDYSHLLELLLFFVHAVQELEVPTTRLYHDVPFDPAPNFELPDEQGNLQELNKIRGSWCVLFFPIDRSESDCEAHMSSMAKIYHWLHSRGIEVICVRTKTPAVLTEIKQRLKIPFIMLSDHEQRVVHRYDISGWDHEARTTLVLNADGVAKATIEYADYARHVIGVILFFMQKWSTPERLDLPNKIDSLNEISWS